MRNKLCPNCNNLIDREVENAKERAQTAIALETGKQIQNAIERHLFRSIDLCNWCYTLLRIYRNNHEKS